MADGLSSSVGLDTTAFKNGAAELIQQVKNIENSFKASAAVMGTWSTSSDGLKSRISSLQEEIGKQKDALDKLHTAYNAAASGSEADQKAANSLAQQMYKLEGQITRNEKALSGYQNRLEASESPAAGLQEKLDALGQQVQLAESKFKVTASAMADWGTKTDGLRSKLDSLKSIESAQGKQVAELESVYAQVAQKQGANSTAANELAIKLNEARAAFEKTGSDIRTFSSDLNTAEAKEKEQSSAMGKLEASFNKFGTQAKESGHSVSNMLSGLKSSIAGFATGLVASLSVKDVISATDAAEKTTAQMAAVLKSTGGAAGMTAKQLGDLATAQAKVTTFSAGTTKQAENMLLTFTNIKGNVFPQTIKAAEDMATAMGTSATDAAKSLGKALNDPANGLSKLTKSGVTFTDAQQKQIKAMQASGNVAGAQTLMLQELEKEFGGSAKAAGSTLTGQVQIMENNLKSAGVQIATALMPIAQTVLPMIVSAAQSLAASITAHKAEIQSTVQNITTAIKEVFGWIETHGPAVKALIIGLAGAFVAFKSVSTMMAVVTAIKEFEKAEKAATLAQAMFNAVQEASPMIIAVSIIAAVIAAIVLLITHWKQVTQIAQAFGAGCVAVFNTVKNAVVSFFAGVGNFFKQWGPLILTAVAPVIGLPLLIIQHWGQIKTFFTGLWSGIKAGMAAAWNGIRSGITALIMPIIAGVQGPFNLLKTGLTNILNGIKNIFSGIWTVIKNVVLGIVLLFCDLVTGNFSKMHSDLLHILTNIKNGFMQIWDGIKQYLTGIWQAIAGAFGTIWAGIFAVAKTIGTSIANFFKSLWSGIRNTAMTAWNGLIGFFSGLPGRIGGIMNSVGSWVRSVWNGLVGFIGSIPGRFASGLSALGGAVRSAFSSAISFIKNLPSEALGWGKDIINGIVNGIKSAASAIGDAVKGVAQDIRKFLHFSKPDTGPLSDFDTYMPDMMSTLANGITGNVGKLRAAAAQAAGVLSGSLQMAVSPVTSGQPVASVNSQSTTNNTKAPVFNINGPINVQDKGSRDATLQQLQFLAEVV